MWSYETPKKKANWKGRSHANTHYRTPSGSCMFSGRAEPTTKLTHNRYQTRTIINDLINGVESKRKVSHHATRSVGDINMELLNVLNHDSYKQPTTTFYGKTEKVEPTRCSFQESSPFNHQTEV